MGVEHCSKCSLISGPPSKLCLNRLCPFQSHLPRPSHCGALEDSSAVSFYLLSGKASHRHVGAGCCNGHHSQSVHSLNVVSRERATCHPNDWLSDGGRALALLTHPNPQSTCCRQTASGPVGWCRVWRRWLSSGTVDVFNHRVLGGRAPQPPLRMPVAPLHSSLSPCPFVLGGPAPPTSARPVDSLFKELVMFGFLKKSETVALKDYVGETPPQPLLPGWEWPKAPAAASPGTG